VSLEATRFSTINMSAYGSITNPNKANPPLPPTAWPLRRKNDATPSPFITIHHLTLPTALALPGLMDYLYAVFAAEVEAGMTYPQEVIGRGAFEAYFFAADVLLAILGNGPGPELVDGMVHEVDLGVDEARCGRTWEDCAVGFYYVKPNYPGRSSHICNAGFVVPPEHRGGGYGSALAKSYVYYAPKLGYQASVFNLVYVNNVASVKLWERLDFTKAGLIPRAGRLKMPGGGEEYVDAWVFYKSFVDRV